MRTKKDKDDKEKKESKDKKENKEKKDSKEMKGNKENKDIQDDKEKKEKKDEKEKKSKKIKKSSSLSSSKSDDDNKPHQRATKPINYGGDPLVKGFKIVNNKENSDSDSSESPNESKKQKSTAKTITPPPQTPQILPIDRSEFIVIRSLCLFDEFQKKSIETNSKPFTVGRDKNNLLNINSVKVSSNQCEIITLEDYALIFDKGSLNGTFIKLIALKPMLLKKNMIFEIGKSLYIFEKEKNKKTLIMKGYDGICKGESIIELSTSDKTSKIVLIGKKKKENTKMVYLEDESLDDEHALILIKNEKFYLMPLESKVG